MTYTRMQIVICASVLWLVIAFGLAACGSSRVNTYSIPISKALTGFTTALPIVAGLLLECGYDLTHCLERRRDLSRNEIQRPPLVIIANSIIFMYSAAVIALLGTHVAPPSSVDCGLRDRWQTLYKQKNEDAVKRIQDAFNCCGLINPRDMPWPFPDKTHDQHSCENAFNRTNGCLGVWKAEEQQTAGLLVGVVAMVFIWQLAIIVIPPQGESWLQSIALHQISRVTDNNHGGSSEAQSDFDFIPGYNRYSDRTGEENGHKNHINSGRTVGERSGHPNNALPGHLDLDQHPAPEIGWASN